MAAPGTPFASQRVEDSVFRFDVGDCVMYGEWDYEHDVPGVVVAKGMDLSPTGPPRPWYSVDLGTKDEANWVRASESNLRYRFRSEPKPGGPAIGDVVTSFTTGDGLVGYRGVVVGKGTDGSVGWYDVALGNETLRVTESSLIRDSEPAADSADDAPAAPGVAAAPSGHAGYLSLLDELRELHLRKGADYGSAADPFENIRAAVNLGVAPHVASLVRAQDKWVRILRFIERGSLENESFEDSLMDMAAYLLITVALLREQLEGESDG